MAQINSFTGKGTVSVSANTTSASSALTSASTGEVVLVSNAGTGDVFVLTGSSTVTVTTATGTPVLADDKMFLSKPVGHTHIAAITPTGTATVYATVGDGNGG